MNIIEAFEDSTLFCPVFKDPATWFAWRVFHKAVFGLPLADGDMGIYNRCTGRVNGPTKRASEVFGIVGRRGGKSFNIALIAIYMTLIDTDWRACLAPGERAIFAIVSVDRLAARVIHGYCRGILNAVPIFQSQIEKESLEEIELRNGAIIQIRTASFRSVRGPSYIGACLDELAFFRDVETAANPASEIIDAIRPALLPGGILFGISSAYNRQGVLYDEYAANWGGDSETLIWLADTLTMNPTFNVAKIAKAKQKDLAVALAEYESQWRDDLASLYSAEMIDRAIIPGRQELPYTSGLAGAYKAFVDPSGGRRDSAALAIAHRDPSGKAVVDCCIEAKAPHSPAEVVERFSIALRKYNLNVVTGDRYGGEWPVEAYRKHGIVYKLSDQTASELYLDALPIFSAGQIELPESQRLRNQLLSLMRRTGSGGKDSVIVSGQGDGSHADLANAVVGALRLASQYRSYGPGESVECFACPSVADGF